MMRMKFKAYAHPTEQVDFNFILFNEIQRLRGVYNMLGT